MEHPKLIELIEIDHTNSRNSTKNDQFSNQTRKDCEFKQRNVERTLEEEEDWDLLLLFAITITILNEDEGK